MKFRGIYKEFTLGWTHTFQPDNGSGLFRARTGEFTNSHAEQLKNQEGKKCEFEYAENGHFAGWVGIQITSKDILFLN